MDGLVGADGKDMLRAIAERGGLSAYVAVSSGELANELGVSQQTASRRILELVDAGLLTRRLGARKQQIRLSANGAAVLRGDYETYRRIFDAASTLVVEGTVVRGLGEGTYYITRDGYRKSFLERLGYEPFPGTLNLRVDAAERSHLFEVAERDGIQIPGFESEGRTFGAAYCLPCEVRGAEAAIILPVRSHHADVVELVSRHHLRKKLDLEDGDEVRVEVKLGG